MAVNTCPIYQNMSLDPALDAAGMMDWMTDMLHIRTSLTRRSTRYGNIGLGLCLLLGLPSCSVMPVADSALEPRRLGRELQTYHAPAEFGVDEHAATTFTEPTGLLTVPTALAAALLNSPALAAFSWEVRAREAHALQAGLRPNPEVGFEVEEFGGGGRTAFDGPETTFLLGQLLELGDKRAKRQRLATLERDLAAWDYETRRLDVLTTVAKVFVVTLAAQERVSLEEEQVQLAQEVLQTVARQVKAGAVSPVEETRAQVALASSRVELSQRKRERTAAQLQLGATWGSTAVTFSAVSGDLETIVPPPSADDLLPHLIHNPDIARWSVEKEQRHAALELEQARQIPNVEVGAGVRYFNADTSAALVFETRMPLMLFDRNQGGIQEAHARLAKAEAEQRAAQVQTRATLAAAHQSLVSAFEQVSALRDSIIPQAQSAFEGVSLAYQRGRLRYLDVLDARRTLFKLRGQYVAALASYHTAVADVERLIAEPLAALDHTDETH